MKKQHKMTLVASSASLVPVSSNGSIWPAGIELALQLEHSLQESFLPFLPSSLSHNPVGLFQK